MFFILLTLILFYFVIGDDIIHYLWYYVFTPGNLLVLIFTILAPYFSRQYFLPYLYHPYRYGGIPFTPPKFIEFQMVYYFGILMISAIVYFVSGYLNSLKLCQKTEYQKVIYNYPKVLLLQLVAIFVLLFIPIFKVYLLTFMIIFPYANELVNGLIIGVATFLGAVWANRSTVYQICGR